jgi:hypothetical protein
LTKEEKANWKAKNQLSVVPEIIKDGGK